MIYIHFPFCKSFCTYCDFYSIRERGKMEQYLKALLREIDVRRAFLMQCAEPATLYIGGGTPSLCPAEWLAEIISAVRNAGGKAGELRELTVEVNPDDVTPEYALGLHRLGVNRVSMGVQSFSDVSLSWMNRRHTAAGAREAFRVLRKAGFDNVSLDLIFGYDPVPWDAPATPDDLLMRQWREDLEQMLLLRPEHISAYQMGVEEGSVLGEKASAGLYRGPSDELCAAQYALLQQMLAEAGYEQYEVSNFALPGRRAVHNSGYWERLPYIGLGPGAHSFDGDRCRSWNAPDVDLYIRRWLPEVSPGPEIPVGTSACSGGAARSGGAPYRTDGAASGSEILTDEDVLVEKVMLGLRRTSGLLLSDVPELDSLTVARLVSSGSLVEDAGRIRIPPSNLFISDTVIRSLLPTD
ncbi:MAG TPA: radical SAM family heme chaperone HemW [Candidatus Coprenecus stercoravium]|uniref:Heme chaperone HemW n=1 Tax=Candidatus Coprenecus stercoravium TaxID=2840735 RepID=A0A9D2GQS7_9BACT|nr:radical SAM family heme chaperone HemW [Candidatus Coprenecus stercoravium]